MEFEWDAHKAASNLSKHGVSFGEAMTVLSDALEVMIPDPAHSATELRFVSIGLSEADRFIGRRLHGARPADRIISARQAAPKERKQYESKGQS